MFSFYKPENYFILDSRISLVLNNFFKEIDKLEYIIPFNHKSAQGISARNRLIIFKKNKSMFNDIGEAYIEYNQLILRIFNKIIIPNNLPARPEIIEMALFSMYK